MEDRVNWLTLLHEPDEIVEIRSIDPKPVISGYFKANSPAIEEALKEYPDRTFYQTMNVIVTGCYSREQKEKLIRAPKQTTTDNDVKGYRWILVDADPVRPSGISSSQAEKEAARLVASNVTKKLRNLGFSDPIVADSGNGYHLLYKIKATPDCKQIIASFLSILDTWFSTDEVKIDTTVSNPARITKLYGTMATKGANTPERPHRKSKMVIIPKEIKQTPFDLIRRIVDESKPANVSPVNARQRNSNGQAFDLEQFLADHSMEVIQKVNISAGVRYQLAECPFDSSHKNGDAAVFAYSNGSYGFHCFHDSCSGYHWHEFREKLDPQAYSNSAYTINQAVPIAPANQVESSVEPQKPRMMRFGEIPDMNREKIVVVKSRFGSLDAKIGGFNKGELSIWSGGNASGKSTLVSQLGLAAIDDGYKVAMFSGEMTAPRVKEWMLLQAAGPQYVEEDKLNPNHYAVKACIKKRIEEYLANEIAIYNNDFGTDWEQVVQTIEDWIKANNSDVVIIDNLMALDITSSSVDKYDIQSKIVKRFALLAKKQSVHIHFICHPRKTDAFLRKSDISGSSDLSNAADNVFMVHRVNADFMARYKSFYPKLEIPVDAGNVIEIMKNRDIGVVDEMIMLYFDPTCKCMSDIKGYFPTHKWIEKIEQLTIDGFTPVDEPEGFPEEWRNNNGQ